MPLIRHVDGVPAIRTNPKIIDITERGHGAAQFFASGYRCWGRIQKIIPLKKMQQLSILLTGLVCSFLLPPLYPGWFHEKRFNSPFNKPLIYLKDHHLVHFWESNAFATWS
jgi:hypothetical protein